MGPGKDLATELSLILSFVSLRADPDPEAAAVRGEKSSAVSCRLSGLNPYVSPS